MNVDQPVAPALDKTFMQDAHEAGQRDESDAGAAQRMMRLGGEMLAIGVGDNPAPDPGRSCPVEARRVGAVADHQPDLGRVGGIGGGVDQRLQIRAAARDQHADPQPGHRLAAPNAAARQDEPRVLMASSRKLRYDRCLRRGAATIRDQGRFAMTLPEAPAVAGRRSRRCRLPGLAATILLTLLGMNGPAARAAEDDPYTTTVGVDATADSIVNAREKARHEGEHKALAAIAERLSPGAAASPKLAKLDDNAVTNLVASFEVANERMSAVRYLAYYTFHFRPAETQRVLKSAGISANAADAAPGAAPSKPIVMLPVYQAGGRAVLWDDPNPWRQAWAELPPTAGAATLAVPLGDVGD